jgi:hypothetical protein
MSSDHEIYVTVEDALSAMARALQWVGEGEDPDAAHDEAAEWLRRHAVSSPTSD